MDTKVSARVHARQHTNWGKYDRSGVLNLGTPGTRSQRTGCPGYSEHLQVDTGCPGYSEHLQVEIGCPGWAPGARDSYTSGNGALRSGAQTRFLQSYYPLQLLACNKIKVLYQNKRDKQIDHKESGGESKFTGG